MKAGTFANMIGSALADLKPEAAYFSEEHGHRVGYLFVNINDASDIPRFAEPFFHAFKAHVEFHPAMTPEDLMRAGPVIEEAIKKYG